MYFLCSAPSLYGTVIIANYVVQYSTIVFCSIIYYSTVYKSYINKYKGIKLESLLPFLCSYYCNVHTVYNLSFIN